MLLYVSMRRKSGVQFSFLRWSRCSFNRASAGVTLMVHDTHLAAACRAPPLFALLIQPAFRADLTDSHEVIDRTDLVVTDMTVIECAEVSTRESAAFMTEIDLLLSDRLTSLFDPGTPLVLYPASPAAVLELLIGKPVVRPGEIVTTGSAVESAGRRQIHCRCLFVRHVIVTVKRLSANFSPMSGDTAISSDSKRI